jgi:precorrin-6B methylase 2
MSIGSSTNDPRSNVNRNIAYQSEQLVRHFSRNRVSWSQFYESERVVIDELKLGAARTVLDIGCGCGGLGLTLRDRFGVDNYTGVEINALSAEAARVMNPRARILCGDFLELNAGELGDQAFDAVFSLSCVDWNVQFSAMLATAWDRVVTGGHLVATFRLTEKMGCDDITQSYQYINFDGLREGEHAAYVVLNASELARHLKAFRAGEVSAYGYWGPPSATAITPYERLCFTAFAIRKGISAGAVPRCKLRLPEEIKLAMESALR